MGLIYRNGIPYGGGGSDIEQFIGTTAEWNALPDEDKEKYVDHEVILTDDGSGSGSSSKDVYSTEETIIGTWIDGKPLYRKVFNVAFNLEGATWTDTGISVAQNNIDLIVSARASSNKILCNGIWIRSDDGANVKATSLSTFNSVNIMILEYTKTTD